MGLESLVLVSTLLKLSFVLPTNHSACECGEAAQHANIWFMRSNLLIDPVLVSRGPCACARNFQFSVQCLHEEEEEES